MCYLIEEARVAGVKPRIRWSSIKGVWFCESKQVQEWGGTPRMAYAYWLQAESKKHICGLPQPSRG